MKISTLIHSSNLSEPSESFSFTLRKQDNEDTAKLVKEMKRKFKRKNSTPTRRRKVRGMWLKNKNTAVYVSVEVALF